MDDIIKPVTELDLRRIRLRTIQLAVGGFSVFLFLSFAAWYIEALQVEPLVGFAVLVLVGFLVQPFRSERIALSPLDGEHCLRLKQLMEEHAVIRVMVIAVREQGRPVLGADLCRAEEWLEKHSASLKRAAQLAACREINGPSAR